jgi:RNA polymerase sigma factor (sigma-70 family)
MIDSELLTRFVEHDDSDALAMLVRRHVDWVNSMAVRLVRDPALADDVTQGVFVLLARKAASLRRQTVLASWLFVVTRYCASAALRKELRRRQHERKAAAMRLKTSDPSEDAPAWEALSPILDELVGRLRETDRQAVLLRFYQSKSFPEIGQAMEISEDAARKRVQRAVDRLRELFAIKGVSIGAGALATTLSTNLSAQASAAVVTSATAAATATTITPLAEGAASLLLWASLKPAAIAVASVFALTITTAVLFKTTAVNQVAAAPAAHASATASVIAGRVITSDEKPVAAARVMFIHTLENATRIVGESTSDSDGNFQFAAAQNQGRFVLVHADGFGLTAAAISPEHSPDEPMEVVMLPPTDLHVKLILPDDKPAAGVSVSPKYIRAQPPDFSMSVYWILELPAEIAEKYTATTDDRGMCVISGLPAEGSTSLQTRDERIAQVTSGRAVNLGDPQATREWLIRVHPGGGFRGRVIGADGKPAAGMRVAAQTTNESLLHGWDDDITDADGRYHLKQLPAGKYNVALDIQEELSKKSTAAAIENVALGAGETATTPDVKLIAGALLTGRVTVKEGGTPVPNVPLGIYGPAHPRSGAWVGNTTTGADGTYALRVPPGTQYVYFSGGMPIGFEAEGSTGGEITVADGAIGTVNFELRRTRGTTLNGRVVDPDGNTVGGATVCIGRPSNEVAGTLFDTVKTDADGKFTVPVATEGTELRARKGRHWITPKPFTLGRSGAKDVTLVVYKDARSSARVRIVGPDTKPMPGLRVEVSAWNQHAGYSIDERTTDADGWCVFKRLAPDTRHSARVESPRGFGTGNLDLRLEPGKPSDHQIEMVRADSFVGGIVLDDKGQPLPDVAVIMSGPRTAWQETSSDAAGRFRFDNVVAGEQVHIHARENDPGEPHTTALAGREDVAIFFRSQQRAKR